MLLEPRRERWRFLSKEEILVSEESIEAESKYCPCWFTGIPRCLKEEGGIGERLKRSEES